MNNYILSISESEPEVRIPQNEKLKEHGLSTQDIDKLFKLLSNAKRYGFDGKEIAEKLYNIQDLELKEKELRDRTKKLSKRISKYKDVSPLTEDIAALGIGIDELLALKVGINQAVKLYNLTPMTAILRLVDDMKYDKIADLERESSSLYMQKYTLDQVCFNQNKSMRDLINLQSLGITKDQVIVLNNFLENNGYKDEISRIS